VIWEVENSSLTSIFFSQVDRFNETGYKYLIDTDFVD